MLEIDEILIENLRENCVTDNLRPSISFSLRSERQDTVLQKAVIRIGAWEKTVESQTDIVYDGALEPFSAYTVQISAYDNHGDIARKAASFQTGRLRLPWQAKWITSKAHTPEKKSSPIPMTFKKSFTAKRQLGRAYITATAIGIFELVVNGKTVTDEYFAPGFTSYKNTLQYVCYDVTGLLESDNSITAVVGGGWAVGRFTYKSKSQITAKRQALLLELFLEYSDGSLEKVVTDESWQVTMEGSYRFGDFYDGESFDATVDLTKLKWNSADVIRLGFKTDIIARYGCPVRAHERFEPVNVFDAPNGETVYDFGQNFAGVIHLEIDGKQGQRVTVRHAEILCQGNLSVKSLRTAKATVTYICREGNQAYSPKLTYMGFRYAGISGIEKERVKVSALAIYSDIEEIGSFECSEPGINRIQSNILWGGKSNFVDIPTDCPQRAVSRHEEIPEGRKELGGTFQPGETKAYLEAAVSVWGLVRAGRLYKRLDEKGQVDSHRLLCKFLRRNGGNRRYTGP
jgi:alpha-L-rhamnosidase